MKRLMCALAVVLASVAGSAGAATVTYYFTADVVHAARASSGSD